LTLIGATVIEQGREWDFLNDSSQSSENVGMYKLRANPYARVALDQTDPRGASTLPDKEQEHRLGQDARAASFIAPFPSATRQAAHLHGPNRGANRGFISRESSCHRERSHAPQRPLVLSSGSFRSRSVISAETEQDRAVGER